LDGLRILQYLKMRIKEEPSGDEANLLDFFYKFCPDEIPSRMPDEEELSFEHSSLEVLEGIRMFLVHKEEEIQATTEPLLPGRRLPAG
jgi:hypothetical protein